MYQMLLEQHATDSNLFVIVFASRLPSMISSGLANFTFLAIVIESSALEMKGATVNVLSNEESQTDALLKKSKV